MQFEQPSALNRFVDASIPLTWTVRWQVLKLCLPLLICASLVLVEQVLFGLWLNDRSFRSGLPLLATCALVPTVFTILAFEVQARIAHRSRRRLNLEAKHVSISPAKINRVALKRILGWRLEPVAGAAELSRLTLEYSLDKKRKTLREWSMVFRSDQESAFLSQTEQLRRAGSTADVVRLPQPMVRRKVNRRLRLRSTAAVALGLYLLIHGMPILAGCLSASSGETEPSRPSRLSARGKAKLREFVALHFASPEEFRRFMIITAGTLTVLGAGFYFWGLSAIKKENALAAAASDATARDDSSNFEAVGSAAAKG